MTESQKHQKVVKKKATQKKDTPVSPEGMSGETKEKLKALDKFIEGVLEEAGEEFVDEFKQVEGQ
jgi:hypothetical protein